MQIALLSDIHGNDVALAAVLNDIANQTRADEIWVLGDIVALGPAPVAVLERLAPLPNVRYIRGNTDRYVCTGDRPTPTLEAAAQNPNLLQILVEVAGTFAWTQGAVSQAGWLPWLSKLPLEIEMTLPDGTHMLAVHAAPGCDDGLGLLAGLSDAELLSVVGDCQADLIFGGHHHRVLDVRVGGKHLVNIGSVSNPIAPDLRASYVVLKADEQGYEVEHRRVDYDRDAVIAMLQEQRHPGAGYIISHLRGEQFQGHFSTIYSV